MNVAEHVKYADELAKNGCFWEAQEHYKKAIVLLKDVADREMNFFAKKRYYDEISIYNDRVQQWFVNFDINEFKTMGKIVDTVRIPGKALGYDYASIFAKYCNADVKEIVIFEPNVFCQEHFRNLRKLLQIFIEHCVNFKTIVLKCNKAIAAEPIQKQLLLQFQSNVALVGLKFLHEFPTIVTSNKEHKIVFGNGFVFIFGKGFNHFNYKGVNDIPEWRIEANFVEIWQTTALSA